MVLDMRSLKDIIEEHVLQKLDHSSIDEDMEEFSASAAPTEAGRLPATTENLAVAIWERLLPHLGAFLCRVRLWETEKNMVSFYGEYDATMVSDRIECENSANCRYGNTVRSESEVGQPSLLGAPAANIGRSRFI
jgi:6-pyruvoyl-tetrahydropterin synthase